MNDMLSNKTLIKAIGLMCRFSKVAAESVAFENSWSVEFCAKNVKEGFISVKDDIDNFGIDFWKDVFNLSPKMKGFLGFCFYDEETRKQNKMLIPLWIVESLPEDFDIEVTSITGENCSIKNIDKDIRFGCVAYLI